MVALRICKYFMSFRVRGRPIDARTIAAAAVESSSRVLLAKGREAVVRLLRTRVLKSAVFCDRKC